ncbi:LysM domain-protein [Dichotomopilus funicola]|uniref:LysM domain-protein n=1 Tax=Dichotomopilus funicola TaxID=1934379 RepID=A0AAN6ZLB0_9PEZI|nr:LysM domain-protein [Dichotomopilus funicola]
MFASTALTALLFGFHKTTAQQFKDYVFPYELLGLSSKCFTAVNTTVTSCPGWLAPFAGIEAASFDLLKETELKALCASKCQDDLAHLRTAIAKGCTGSKDVMAPGGVAYPATFLVDRYLYASSLSCLRDSATGEYCDIVVAAWRNQTEPYTAAQNCSECQIGIQAKQLASPFGYDKEAASAFAFTTSSCAAKTYSYATPTSYALNSTTVPPSRPTCATNRTYVIQKEDSCNTIAEAQGVATEALISLNGLDLGCTMMLPVNTSLCLPPACKIQELSPDDTCRSIITAQNITISQLLAWNPIISAGCGNLDRWRGRFICVSSPGGTIDVPDGNATTTEAPIPTNTQGGSNTHCGQWYTVQPDDSCASISIAFSIALADFYFLNPQVDKAHCNNLWLGSAYCVKPVGNIQTYPDYPVSVPSTTFTRPPPANETEAPPPVLDMPALNPRAEGTVDGCDSYENGWPEAVTAQNPDANTCVTWANMGDVTVAQLRRWNPSLTEEKCVLSAAYSYCIVNLKDKDAQTREDSSSC